ncbi:MAG: NUMOD3 domain-containing DNA-binding protein [Gammaproteobacteria bacterium]
MNDIVEERLDYGQRSVGRVGKSGIIYLAECLTTGKGYVGQTMRTLRTRKQGHLLSAKKGRETPFCNALRKHGAANFRWRVMFEMLPCVECLNRAEEWCIEKWNTLAPNGYNATTGGGNKRVSEETRRKMKKIMNSPEYKSRARQSAIRRSTPEYREKIANKLRGRKRPEVAAKNRGRKMSAAARKKMSEAKRGKPSWNKGLSPSAITRAKIAASLRGRFAGKNNPACRPGVGAKISAAKLGHKHSAEARAKMSAAHRRRVISRRTAGAGGLL